MKVTNNLFDVVEASTLVKSKKERVRLSQGDMTAEGSVKEIVAVGAAVAMLLGVAHLARAWQQASDMMERRRPESSVEGGVATRVVGDVLGVGVAGRVDKAIQVVVSGTLSDAIREMTTAVPVLGGVIRPIPNAARAAATEMVETVVREVRVMRDTTSPAARSAAARAMMRSESVTDPAVQPVLRQMLRHATRLDRGVQAVLLGAYHDGIAFAARTREVTAVLPLWRIVAVGDEVTRGRPDGRYPEPHRHFQMSGYVSTIADMIRMRIVPPNGFNCRCTIEALTVDEAERLGLLVGGLVNAQAVRDLNGNKQQYIDRGLYPDRDFDRN